MGQTLFISFKNLFNYQDEQELRCLYQRVNHDDEYIPERFPKNIKKVSGIPSPNDGY
jgi:hypothetical protein